jgi:hypothetical protein
MRWTQWVHWIRWLRLCDELKCHYVPSLHRSCPSVQPQHYVRITPAVPCSLATISNWMPSLFGVYDSTLNPVCRPPDGSYVPLPLCHRFDLLLRNLAYLYQSNATVKFLAVLLNHSRIQRFLVKFIWNFRPPGLPQPVHITHIIICRQALHKDKVRLSHPRRVRISACSIYSADYAHKDRSG